MFILTDEVGARGTIILIKSLPHWCDSVECSWGFKFTLLCGIVERDSAGGVLQCNYASLTGISVATVIMFLVKRKSICTDVYEWKIVQRKIRAETHSYERGTVKIEDRCLHVELVCLLVWLAAVSVVLHCSKLHNEKHVFEFNSLLSFIIVFQTRAHYHCYRQKMFVSQSGQKPWIQFSLNHSAPFCPIFVIIIIQKLIWIDFEILELSSVNLIYNCLSLM